MSVSEALNKIEERIQQACQRSGRSRQDIRLMAVSKFQDLDKIREAYAAGLRLFGESRVQEALLKFGTASTEMEDIELHCIGHLQRNKVKTAIQLFSCIQSVDRNELITELALQCQKAEKKLAILLELHTGESSKAGYPDTEALLGAAELALNHPQLELRGLMTMAPFTKDEKPIRQSFRTLMRANQIVQQHFPALKLDMISMGMSNDFEIAIEEGSTLLRIGTAIFAEEER